MRLISDFNISPLAGFLRNMPINDELEIEVAPFGQVQQTLSNVSESWIDVVWTTPERTLSQFHKAFCLLDVNHEEVLREVEDFVDTLVATADGRFIFLTAWTLPEDYFGYGMLDWRDGIGLSNLLAKCNIKLSEEISKHSNVFLLPTHLWLQKRRNSTNRKLWYAAKIPYNAEVFEAAARSISQCILGIKGKSRRLIVLDLDNTLWGGVVGENGWQSVRLGGHDHIGEAFRDFQLELKALSNLGIQLAIVSKNDEEVALEAIENNPEMILKQNDFAGWRINWDDKAENIVDLIHELNLGISSVVFIDDNPAERTRVADALKDIFVPDWPADPANYVSALRNLGCFETPTISQEDRNRKKMYSSDRIRRDTKKNVRSNKEWLKKLNTEVIVEPVNVYNIGRVAQLINKTNQLNLTTRRLSESEITDWVAKENHRMMAISVSDCFGELGLVGLVGVASHGNDGQLVDFILSCRVMGRKVEETLIYLASHELTKLGCTKMKVCYSQTERNRPTLEVLEKANLHRVDTHNFELNLHKAYAKPEHISLKIIEK